MKLKGIPIGKAKIKQGEDRPKIEPVKVYSSVCRRLAASKKTRISKGPRI